MKKVLALLGLQAFTFQSNFWGQGEAHVKLTKEQLEKIDAALEQKDSASATQTIADLKEKVSGFEANETAVQEALTNAFEANGLTLEEGKNPAEAIAALSAKCKEHGEATNTHSIPKTNGKDKQEGNGLINGYIDPNAEHNQIIAKVFNR